MSELSTIETSLNLISPDAKPDTVLEIYDQILAHFRMVQDLKRRADEAVLAYVIEHGPLAVSPGVGYFASTPKKTECIDRYGLVQALLEAGGGDVSESSPLAMALASGAFKHGYCAAILPPDVFAKYFKVTYPPELENGKLPKCLVKIDDAFTKTRRAVGGKDAPPVKLFDEPPVEPKMRH